MSILQISGDLLKAQASEKARTEIARVRVALITGGRGFLAGAGKSKVFVLTDSEMRSLGVITLDQSTARRLYTSGGTLTDEEIAEGMAQLRVADEDVAKVEYDETAAALHAGMTYAREQFDKALNEGDERALHQAWEMARKVNGLRKRMESLADKAGRST